MTGRTDTTVDLSARYAAAIRAAWPGADESDVAAAARAVRHVRDSELDRLVVQVADYERQLLELIAVRDRQGAALMRIEALAQEATVALSLRDVALSSAAAGLEGEGDRS